MSDGGDYGHTRDSAGKDGPARLTTRTRLPGSEGGGRPPSRPGRSLITVVGVIVLLIAAIAFANQGGDGGDPRSEEGRNGGAQPQPTAPSGKKPVDSTDSPATGFPRTQQGAQSAAANYAVALGGDGMFKPDRRHDIVRSVAAPDSLDKLQSGFDADYNEKLNKGIGLDRDGNAPSGTTFVNRTIPAGTDVQDFGSGKATVSVWCTGLFGLAAEDSTKPVKTSWFTVTFKLRWADDDWKVVDTTQKKGPTPVSGDSPVSGADEIGEATKKYGGFTYAR